MKQYKYFISYFLLLAVITTAMGQNTVSGYVRTNGANPVADCVVSDGLTVTKTNASGAYSLIRSDSTEFVFISVPSAYELPTDTNNLPLFYQKVTGAGNFTHDFTLTPFSPEALTADLNHVLIAFGDPQVYNDYETYLFGKESIQDMKDLTTTYPEGTHFYGAAVGDLVWDVYTRFAEHTANCKQLGFPVFQVIGNHDHDRAILQDWGADHFYKDNYGPTYYSVNRGNIHYITLDDIEYTNVTGDKSYRHNIVDYQMRWLERDLAETPASMSIVFLVHAPIEGSAVANRQTLYNLVSSRRNTHAISGHQHVLRNYEISNKFYDHTLPAVGGLWNGYLNADGTPPGYTVFQAGNTGFASWFFKSTGLDRNYQMRAYPVNSFVNGESMTNKITANVWNYDSKWSDVSIYENNVKHIMYQYSGLDPLARDFLMDEGDTRPNYGGADVGQPTTHNLGASATPHMFNYEPTNPNADFEVEVTDRNGVTYREKVLKNLMVASFEKESDNSFYYRQNFDVYRTYPNQYLSATKTGKSTYVQGHSPAGWYSCTSGSADPSAGSVTWQQFNYICIDNGSSMEGALYAYGNGNPATGASNDVDRAMGSLIGSLARNIHFGVLLENNTGTTLDGIELSYTGEMWRGGTSPTREQRLKFAYLVNPDILSLRKRTASIADIRAMVIDSLAFVSPFATTTAGQNAACNGNAPENQVKIAGKIATRLYPGDVIMLRWEDIDDAANDNALAIDDLVIKAINEQSSSIDKTQINNKSFYNVGTTVFFDGAPMSVVSLYDGMGILVWEKEISTKQLDLSPYVSSGIYFLKTTFGTKKMIF